MKYIKITLATLFLLSFSGAALAAVETGQVLSVRTTASSGWTMIDVDGATCTDGSLNTPKISPSSAGYDKIVSNATAALLSGREVTVDYNASTCVITWFRIE